MTAWRLIFVAMILASTAALAAGTSVQADVTSRSNVGPLTLSASSAVQEAVELGGRSYAGDCAATRSPDDAGKVCSKLVDSEGDVSAYLTGRTFSEFDTWLFVIQTSDGYCPSATAPLDSTMMSDQIPWPAGSAASPSTCVPAAIVAGTGAAAG